ncbi:MAG TPA: TonB-dependent receptor [Saprospiraceae bacterium]|nr:TonB-dependent receptor [Saprospiraceae bacterium]HRO07485.1 TonB-dependent receptor [Saprospiraceae bacterium]HRP40768.1 TonB-dependent receptor [Saprospiraceae bacterium]
MKSIILASLCLWHICAMAQPNAKEDTSKTNILNEILIQGYKIENPTFSTVSNNYNEKIVQPKNVAGLFDDINGFSLIKRGNYAMDPTFRGVQYEQINIQYDGGVKAMHACPNRMDPITSHISPEEIEKIEIIKGPYSVRYGASFGGIVNLVTRDPAKGKHGLHGSVGSGYESNGNSRVGMAQLGYIYDRLELAGNVGYRNYGNYKDGSGTSIPSSFKSTDYGLKLGYHLTDNQYLRATWRQAYGRDVLHAGLAMDTDFDDSSIAALDYKWKINSKAIRQWQIKSYYSYVDHLMTNLKRSNSKMMEMKSRVNAATTGIKSELEWKTSDYLRFFSGVDYQHTGRDGNRTTLIKMQNGKPLPEPILTTGSIWQDAYIDNTGIYTEAKWSFLQNYFLTAGVRYDIVTSDIRKPDADFAAKYNLKKRNEGHLSGTISLKKALSDNMFLELAFGRGVRSANMIERYINKFNVGQDSYTYTGDPGLKAEINHQSEIGISGYQHINDVFTTIHFEGSVYYSTIKDYISAKIQPAYGPNSKVFVNIENAMKTGADLSLKLDLAGNYYVKTDLSYVYARNKDSNEFLPLIPPFTTRITAGFDNNRLWYNLMLNVVAAQDNISPSFGESQTPAYRTLDLKLGYKPWDNVSLGVAGLNIFNATYHNHLNFSFRNQEGFAAVPVNEPGRNITAFIQFTF